MMTAAVNNNNEGAQPSVVDVAVKIPKQRIDKKEIALMRYILFPMMKII